MKNKKGVAAIAICGILILAGFTLEISESASIQSENDSSMAEWEEMAGRFTTLPLTITTNPVDDANIDNTITFTDGRYYFKVNKDDNYMKRISSNPQYYKTHGDVMPTGEVDADAVLEKGKGYFDKAIGHLVEGELVFDVLDKDDMGYIITINEKLNGIETGTSASLILDKDGTIRAALFIKGFPEEIRNLDISRLLSESDAIEIAVTSVKTEKNETRIVDADITAELKNFKGQLYWYVIVPTSQKRNGEEYVKNYSAYIDAINGNILELYEELLPSCYTEKNNEESDHEKAKKVLESLEAAYEDSE